MVWRVQGALACIRVRGKVRVKVRVRVRVRGTGPNPDYNNRETQLKVTRMDGAMAMQETTAEALQREQRLA